MYKVDHMGLWEACVFPSVRIYLDLKTANEG